MLFLASSVDISEFLDISEFSRYLLYARERFLTLPAAGSCRKNLKNVGTTNSKHNKHSGSKETKHAYILQNDLGANYSVEDIKASLLANKYLIFIVFFIYIFFSDLSTFYEFDILYNLMNLLLIWRPQVVSWITAPKITLFQETVFFCHLITLCKFDIIYKLSWLRLLIRAFAGTLKPTHPDIKKRNCPNLTLTSNNLSQETKHLSNCYAETIHCHSSASVAGEDSGNFWRTNCPFTLGRCSASFFLLWYLTC